MSLFNHRQRNSVVLFILILLGACVVYSLRAIAGSMLSTIIMFTILRPVYLYFADSLRWRRSVAALTVMIGSFIIIILPFLTLTMMVINKIADFKKDAIRIRVIGSKIDDFLSDKFNQPDMYEHLIEKSNTLAGELFPSILGGAGEIALGITIMYFLLYFMFTQHEEFEAGMLKYAPFREQNALKFATELKNITYSNVLGQGFIAFVQGALVSIGFFIFGIDDAIFWGVVCIFLSFLPVVGAPIVFIPAALIQIFNGNTFSGTGLLLWGLILVINIDNVIRFIIAKRVADTHPIITVIGVIIGIPMFGIMGLVFGPLLLSYFILTIRIYETSKMASERLEKIRLSEEKNNISENTL
ncbi:AI-2E family transporter [Hufsiella ginkgonis]|uniref:AI-2E family transporter n=1 Tax=Hufsiella ginkgonis TaxID=2695274 RepID=A0A7K1XT10_9SPHI|nr:AI-2E family transporter [Hufsiella ginkgonis]MXV14135.1 AI-2E family transporter [Hufsiella ginkgonis]